MISFSRHLFITFIGCSCPITVGGYENFAVIKNVLARNKEFEEELKHKEMVLAAEVKKRQNLEQINKKISSTGDEIGVLYVLKSPVEDIYLQDMVPAMIASVEIRSKSGGIMKAASKLVYMKNSDVRNRITADDVVDECKTFFLAGHETISSALTCT
ncbi:hypothetical protein ACH5RR_035950 [Cinchona calisaya]|uniref:Uncharacterized protein n=1 Tax=Cinchona calisaya TaxID=153742 RepID=A0ABD2Y1T3_9GENT